MFPLALSQAKWKQSSVQGGLTQGEYGTLHAMTQVNLKDTDLGIITQTQNVQTQWFS